MGFGSDSGHETSTTKSGVSTANMKITNAKAQQQLTGKTAAQSIADAKTKFTTEDIFNGANGNLKNNYDKDEVQQEVELQAQVTKDFDGNRQFVKQKIYANAKSKAEQAKKIRMDNGGRDNDESKKLDEQSQSLKKGAMYFDMVAGATFAGTNTTALAGMTVTTQADLAKVAATADKKMIFVKCDESGSNCKHKEVNINSVKATNDKINVFNNGIFNTEKTAINTAIALSSPEARAEGIYIPYNPQTGNPVAEIAFYALYDKVNEMTGSHLPITNASKGYQDILLAGKQQGAVVDSDNHSRGGLTNTNAVKDLYNRGVRDTSIGVTKHFGSAANTQRAAEVVDNVSGKIGMDAIDKINQGRGLVTNTTYPTDIVGRIVGGNPSTMTEKLPDGKQTLKFPSSHISPYILYKDKETIKKYWGNDNIGEQIVLPQRFKQENK